MKKRNIIFLILIFSGLFLSINGVSADIDKTYSVPCPKNSSHNATVDYSESFDDYKGIVKLNGSYYKKYATWVSIGTHCSESDCWLSDWIDYPSTGYVKCTGKDIVKTSNTAKYWKTVKSKGKYYQYYKVNVSNLYGDGNIKTNTVIKKKVLKTFSKKKTISESVYSWYKYGYYTDGYIKLKSGELYINGYVEMYNYFFDINIRTPVYTNKIKINSLSKNVKITKVVMKSIKYPSLKKFSNTYKNPKNGKVFKSPKYTTFDKIVVYYKVKKYVWVK